MEEGENNKQTLLKGAIYVTLGQSNTPKKSRYIFMSWLLTKAFSSPKYIKTRGSQIKGGNGREGKT